jgi:hypothetical protein
MNMKENEKAKETTTEERKVCADCGFKYKPTQMLERKDGK